MTDHTSFDDELSPEEAAALATWLRDPAVWAEPSPGVEDQVVAAITAASSTAGGRAPAPDARSWSPSGPAALPGPTVGTVPPVTSVSDSGAGPVPPVSSVADPGHGEGPGRVGGGSGPGWDEPIALGSRRRRATGGQAARRALAGLAVAAVALVAALGTLRFVSPADDDPGLMVELAGSELAPDATARAEIFDQRNGVRIVLRVQDLPPAPDGSFYAAWVVREEGPRSRIPIGSFHLRGGDGAIELWSGVPLEGYPVVSVTLQSEDDPAGPGQPMLRGRIGG